MPRILGCLSLCVVMIAMSSVRSRAGEWEDEFPITQDPLSQYRFYPTIAPDQTLYVLWPDWTVWEDTQILLSKSPDRGATWTDPEVIFAGAAYDNMDLHADAGGLHLLLVEFYEEEEELKYLYYAKSTDGGEFFSDPIRIGTRENIEATKIFSRPGRVYIYAQNYDHQHGLAYNYLYVSEDVGETWVEKPLLPGHAVQHPSFVADGGLLHVAFGGFLAIPDIMHSTSADDGDNWTAPVPVSSGAGSHSQLPDIAVDDEAIHVTWEDDRIEHFNVMYTRSTDGGVTWSVDEQVNDTFYGARAKLLADEEGLHVVWCQYHGDDGWPSSWSSADYGILWYKFSDDSGVTWTPEFRVSQNEHIPPINLPSQGANYVQLGEYGAGFCALWLDKRDGNIDLYMRNNQGPAGVVRDLAADAHTFASQALWSTPQYRCPAALSFRVRSEGDGQLSCSILDVEGRERITLPGRQIIGGREQTVDWPMIPLGHGIHYAQLRMNDGRSRTHRLLIIR